MITCRDVYNLRLDGVELLTGEVGLERMVSWTYMVQTKPFDDHMNPGNFALIVIDYVRFTLDVVPEVMVELNDLGISGLAISIENDKDKISQEIIDKALEMIKEISKIGNEALSIFCATNNISKEELKEYSLKGEE